MRDREQGVAAARFGIGVRRKTLSAIGEEMGLSRERVRQIEKEALRKLSLEILGKHNETINQIIASFEKVGGLSLGRSIAAKFLEERLAEDSNQINSLALIFYLMPQLKKIKKTREIEEGWILAKISRSEAIRVINDWVSHLRKKEKPQSLEILMSEHPQHQKYEITFLSELPAISKKLIQTPEGHLGLVEWAEINPRTTRDKIYYVMKRAAEPLHFDEIVSRIRASAFDKKKVVRATVHNELIADRRFVLVGRGIYALRELGYSEGTVGDVIMAALKNKKSGLLPEEIIRVVMRQRVVKRNTVLINLKTRREFQKTKEGKYILEISCQKQKEKIKA